jgi:hypothetical protein
MKTKLALAMGPQAVRIAFAPAHIHERRFHEPRAFKSTRRRQNAMTIGHPPDSNDAITLELRVAGFTTVSRRRLQSFNPH